MIRKVHPKLWVIKDCKPIENEFGCMLNAELSSQFEKRCQDEAIPTNMPLPQSVLGLAWCGFMCERDNRRIARDYWLEARLIAHRHMTMQQFANKPKQAVAA